MGKSINNLSSVTVVGLDIAKNVFQVHGVEAKGAAIVARSVRRLGPLTSTPPIGRGERPRLQSASK
jgi:hypothetical protein